MQGSNSLSKLIIDIDLTSADLNASDLRNTIIKGTKFDKTNLSSTKLIDINCSRASDVNLENTTMLTGIINH